MVLGFTRRHLYVIVLLQVHIIFRIAFSIVAYRSPPRVAMVKGKMVPRKDTTAPLQILAKTCVVGGGLKTPLIISSVDKGGAAFMKLQKDATWLSKLVIGGTKGGLAGNNGFSHLQEAIRVGLEKEKPEPTTAEEPRARAALCPSDDEDQDATAENMLITPVKQVTKKKVAKKTVSGNMTPWVEIVLGGFNVRAGRTDRPLPLEASQPALAKFLHLCQERPTALELRAPRLRPAAPDLGVRNCLSWSHVAGGWQLKYQNHEGKECTKIRRVIHLDPMMKAPLDPEVVLARKYGKTSRRR